jgi:CHAT domain-containing protein/tetratricopeptide (TPR) repeat protein
MVAKLLSIAETERQGWLEAHRPVISLALIEALKTEMEKYKLRDPRRAVEIAEVALEAASFLSDPLAMALALWTKGNALMYMGDFRACAKAYQSAEATYDTQGDSLSVARLQSYRVFALTNLGRHREALALAETARRGLVAAGHGNGQHMAMLEMNVGVACRQASHYDEALAAYERGRAIFEKLGNGVQVARMDINRAKVLEKLDRFREAASLLEAARVALLAQEVALDVARVDLNLAHLSFRRGRYRQALEVYTRARDSFATLANEMEVAAIDFYRSQVYLALNLFTEAKELASHARQTFVERGMARYAIQATARQAAATRGLGDVVDALALFDQARAGLEERGEVVEVAFLDLQRAALLHQVGQLQAALDTARAAAETLKRHGLLVRLAQAQLMIADCLLNMGRAEEAAPLYTAVLEVAKREELTALAYRARYGLGRVAEAGDDNETAEQHYQAATADLEAIHRDLRVDEFQASFMDDKLDVYEAAVRLALRRGDVETAFDYVERAKAGALLDLLARGLELLGKEDEELLARLQALREEWHWHASQSEGQAPGEDVAPDRSGEPGRWAALRDVEYQLSEAWRQLRLRRSEPAEGQRPEPFDHAQDEPVEGRRHRYATLIRRQRLSSAQVGARLPDDTVLIEYYTVAEEMLAFLVYRHNVEVVELGAIADQVEGLIGTWRFDLNSLRLMLPDLSPAESATLEADSRILLQRLYEVLIAPLAEQLVPYRRLIVVPHQALHYLPLSALHNGQEYLVDHFQTSYLPGASLLKVSSKTSEVFGDLRGLPCPLVLAHSDGGRLPHTLDEARQVATVLKEAQVFLEAEATEARLREHGPACGLLHLATHGAFRADNPLFSWLRLADARLTVRDVYDLHLPHAALVTLSACETGLGDLRGGEVLGLSQSFLAAGAQSLLLSLWAVDDVSTAHLMAAFYRRLAAGQTKVSALQEAQREVREQYPHPFHWAGFALIGEGD